MSEIDGIWSGDFLKNQTDKKWPELFLYSKTDFYLPWRYLEDEVILSLSLNGLFHFNPKVWEYLYSKLSDFVNTLEDLCFYYWKFILEI
jgi:hypothetical protein